MTAVRVLVGIRKGAFVLSSDAKRKKWTVDGTGRRRQHKKERRCVTAVMLS